MLRKAGERTSGSLWALLFNMRKGTKQRQKDRETETETTNGEERERDREKLSWTLPTQNCGS